MVSMPVAQGFYVTSPFGPRSGGFHYGTDFGRAGGSGGHPVYAVKDGTVTRAGAASGFGRWVTVDHPASNGGGETIYGHIIPEVTAGQRVREGQRIARIDPNSATNGGVAPHLHLEWHRYSWVPPGPDRLDPMTKLAGAAWPGSTPPPAVKETPMRLTWLADVLRAAGLKVIEQPGWKTRGHADFRSVTHVMWHHTAGGGDNDWYWVQHGTNGLAGPLSQLVLERDGTFRVIAAGVAWHAGVGSWPGIPTNAGNYHTIGVEAVNNGRGQPWPEVQREAYRLGTAAILKKLGRDETGVVAHKEYAKIQGKIDPFPFDMDDERRRVRALLRGTPPTPVRNEIDHYAAQPEHAWIGKRLTPAGTEVPVGPAGRGGRAVEYESAIVYWSPTTGAHAVPRADPALGPDKSGLLEEFQRRSGTGGPLGFPIREFTRLLDNPRGDTGAVQSFEGGVLYRQDGRPRGWPVFGKIGEHWAKSGYENGPSGYPIGDEYPVDGGFIAQDFQHDRLIFSPSMVVPKSAAVK